MKKPPEIDVKVFGFVPAMEAGVNAERLKDIGAGQWGVMKCLMSKGGKSKSREEVVISCVDCGLHIVWAGKKRDVTPIGVLEPYVWCPQCRSVYSGFLSGWDSDYDWIRDFVQYD